MPPEIAQGTPREYNRGVPALKGRRKMIAPNHQEIPPGGTTGGCPEHIEGRAHLHASRDCSGHPPGVQPRGARGAWTEGSEPVHNNIL